MSGKNERPGWDEYFMKIARVVSTRSTCFRRHVGAVIVRDKYIISTGYNGAPQHQPNCGEVGFCYRDENDIKSGTQLERCRASGSHAESNAIAIAARNGFSTDGASMYVHGHEFVCNQCKAIIANAGITNIYLERGSGEVDRFMPSIDWTTHPVDSPTIRD